MTLARQRVRSDVHLESTETDVNLLAVLAGEGLFRLTFRRGTVKLLMLRQSGIRGIRFSTVWTLIPWRSSGGGRRERRGGAARRALLYLNVYDRWASRCAAGGRSSTVASRGRQVFGSDRWRRPKGSRSQGTGRRQTEVIGTGPVSVAPGDRFLDRRAGQSGVRRRRDRRMMLGRGMWISWHRIGRIEFRARMMISVGCWIG